MAFQIMVGIHPSPGKTYSAPDMQFSLHLTLKEEGVLAFKMQEAILGMTEEASLHFMLCTKVPRFKMRIFYDHKLKDVANTMARRIRRLVEMGVDIVSVWIDEEGLPTVIKMLHDYPELAPHVCGVTVLTTISEEQCLAIHHMERIPFLVQQAVPAAEAGMGDFVCAVNEARAVRVATTPALAKSKRAEGKNLRVGILSPALRLPGEEAGGQVMVATPAEAKRAGVDYGIVERPIVDATDLRGALRKYLPYSTTHTKRRGS
jgi:orotidine-5'-phosphate decarboxylase